MWDLLDSDQWLQYHPTKLLAHFAETLEELYCMAWYTNQEAVYPVTVYPKMRKLAIELHDLPLRIDSFIRAFPNLTDLYVTTEYHGELYSEDIEVSHSQNVAHQLGNVASCGTWAHLERFHGRLFDLYALGLTCHISRVVIVSALEDGPHTDMLRKMLRYAKPSHLKLEGITGAMLGGASRGFISMLRHASASNLVNLNVDICFRKDDREKDLTGTMEDLFSALSRLPLKFLKLRFYTHDLDPTPMPPSQFRRQLCALRGLPEPPVPVPAPLTAAELSLLALDMDALVTRTFASLTELEAARVTMPRFPRRGGETFKKKIVKGTHVPGREQWRSWPPGKNEFVWN
uniref:Histone acetyltransferase type B catalytic subunit (EC) n=1 Tax=Ganoderma boninense TaxID=34458 RepID=A0A5K1K0M2_9APHY|nr:Histone acetyltransferase type B catalytic subunit (EC [Ganoderma boninense]